VHNVAGSSRNQGATKGDSFTCLGASKLIAASGFNIPAGWAQLEMRSESAEAAERLSTSPFWSKD